VTGSRGLRLLRTAAASCSTGTPEAGRAILEEAPRRIGSGTSAGLHRQLSGQFHPLGDRRGSSEVPAADPDEEIKVILRLIDDLPEGIRAFPCESGNPDPHPRGSALPARRFPPERVSAKALPVALWPARSASKRIEPPLVCRARSPGLGVGEGGPKGRDDVGDAGLERRDQSSCPSQEWPGQP